MSDDNRIPPGWRVAKLGELVSTKVGREVPAPSGRLPFLGMDGVERDSGRILAMSDAHSVRSASPRAPRGSVLYGRLRPYLNKVAVAPEEMYVSGEFIVMKPTEMVDARFLRLRLSAQDFVRNATSLNAGDRPRVRWSQIAEYRLALPGVDEQRRIADVLEDHLSRLDAADTDLIAAGSRSVALLRAAWQESFSGGVDRVSLAEVVTIENGHTPAGLIGSLLAEPTGTTVPFFKVGDMNDQPGRAMSSSRTYIEMVDAARFGAKIRQPGTVLIPKRGGAIATNKKRLLREPAAYDLNIMGLRPRPRITLDYLLSWFDGVDLGAVADGSNVPQINARQIANLSIPVPGRDVQVEVAARLSRASDDVERVGRTTVSARRRSAGLRRALLHAAFTGRLTGAASDMDRVEEIAATA